MHLHKAINKFESCLYILFYNVLHVGHSMTTITGQFEKAMQSTDMLIGKYDNI